jgi:hypothetical protein
MPKNFQQIDRCYRYLQAQAGQIITFGELRRITAWSEENLKTNISKRIREFLVDKYERGVPPPERKYYVNRNILNVALEDFHDLFRQKNWVFSRYDHKEHDEVRIYDFYLPLTNENLLRQNLDELFYEDTLNKRLRAIDLSELIPIYPRNDDETDPAYYRRLTTEASDLFWGYSISHVGGRFRTGNKILTKQQAAAKEGKAYLVDETTAVVRFVFPHEDGKAEYHQRLDQLFRLLFVKAITESTPDEDEIWLLESFGSTTLHRYVKLPWDR